MIRRPHKYGAVRTGNENGIKRAILQFLAYAHIPAYRLNSGAFALESPAGRRFFRATFAGCPDIVAILDDGRTLWIEVKSATGKLSPGQEQFRDLCQVRGVPWLLARSVDDVAQYVDLSRRQRGGGIAVETLP